MKLLSTDCRVCGTPLSIAIDAEPGTPLFDALTRFAQHAVCDQCAGPEHQKPRPAPTVN